MRRLTPLLACLSFVVPLIAAAPDTFTRADLEALEAQRRAAMAQLAVLESQGQLAVTDLRTLDETLLSASMEARRREEQASRAELELARLEARRTQARRELLKNETALEDLLAALAAANRRKPPSLVVSPDNSGIAIRRAILMQATYPQLSERAGAISNEIAELNALELNIRTEQARLGAAEATLALKRQEIERLAASKREAYEGMAVNLDGLRDRADRLSSQAGTLRELLAALETNAPSAPRAKPQARPQLAALRTVQPGKSKPSSMSLPSTPTMAEPLGTSELGGLRQPVSGSLLQGFGASLPNGGKTEYVVFKTRAEAQVTAPVGAVVEFARPFRTYGQMLILRTSDGYRVILSGMSRIYVSEGQSVSAGEPVGRMPDRNDPAPELSVELRLGDKVLDPAQWMPSDD